MTALVRKIGVLSAVVTLGGVLLWLDIDLGDEADIAQSSRVVAKTDVSQLSLDIDSTTPHQAIAVKNVQLNWHNVAFRHEDELSFPSYSQPIKNSAYQYWNQFIPIEVPVLNGQTTAALVAEKFRYFYPEAIQVELVSNEVVQTATLDVVDINTQVSLASLDIDDGKWHIIPSKTWPQELRLVARIDFSRGYDVISADVRLYHSVASIDSVSPSFAKGPDLVIPVDLDIKKAGIFRLRANLYKTDGIALASLVEKEHLLEGLQTIELKAYKRVLPSGRSNYELGDIIIERMSGFPGEKAMYGNASPERFPLGSFDTDSLTDEAYQMTDHERQQLRFLNQLAGN
ncbi:hypothetical protein MHN79_02370 [Vibrio sp. Of14-4]|uniref:hypothetical protein n=1 Tax=Vibrio sp. Of14-4 TaxID=2724878 RepID=UPI001EF1EA68|nr:hypothetical protein [Vibrio sp. Of14-4]MCG7488324.1 hypothetical protein [Vibrio sp. Of14-4]